jgi:amidase
MRHAWLPTIIISITSSIGLSAGLLAAENVFRLEETTVAEIHEAVAAGALSSGKLVELYLARIAAYDRAGPRLNSIMYINPNAKAEAAALDKERADKGPRGPLHGIPILLKDNIDVINMATTNGSAVMKDAIPPEDGSITKALRAAGAVILAKTAMGEFAGGSYNSVRGQTLNPYNVKRATGGSSSGSAAAERRRAQTQACTRIPNDGVVLDSSLMRSGFSALTVSPATAPQPVRNPGRS